MVQRIINMAKTFLFSCLEKIETSKIRVDPWHRELKASDSACHRNSGHNGTFLWVKNFGSCEGDP